MLYLHSANVLLCEEIFYANYVFCYDLVQVSRKYQSLFKFTWLPEKMRFQFTVTNTSGSKYIQCTSDMHLKKSIHQKRLHLEVKQKFEAEWQPINKVTKLKTMWRQWQTWHETAYACIYYKKQRISSKESNQSYSDFNIKNDNIDDEHWQ